MFKIRISKLVQLIFMLFFTVVLLQACNDTTIDNFYQVSIENNGVEVVFSKDIKEKIVEGTELSFWFDAIPENKEVIKVTLDDKELQPKVGIYKFIVNKDGFIKIHLGDVYQERQIVYQLNGGTNHIDNPSTYQVNDKPIQLHEAFKKGYTFMGWYLDDQLVEEIDPALDKNLILTAQFEKITYTIDYNLNGGTNHKDNPLSYTIEDNIYTLFNPSKAGNKFIGWFDENDNQYTEISPNNGVNLKLIAVFEPLDYTIVYHYNGGEKVDNPTQYQTSNQTIELLPTTKKGYTFLGWFIDDLKVSTLSLNQTKPINIEARFEVITYTISFNNQLYEPIEFTVEDEIALPVLEVTGYTFKGWVDGDDNLVLTILKGTINDINLTAKLEINTYTLTIKYDDVIQEFNYTYNEAIIPVSLEDKVGYRFKGFDIELPKTMPNHDLTLTPLWEIMTFNIKFVHKDGSLIEEQTIEYDQLPTPPTAPTKNSENGYDYTFDGWDKEVVKAVEDTTYQATFKRTPIVYTITYEGLDEATHSNPTSYTIETEITLLTDPSAKLHHTFSGWYLGEQKIGQIGGGLTGNLVVTAIFIPNSYVIRFINEDGSLIEAQTVEYNQLPAVPNTPTKDSENGYEYTFDGWDKEVVKAVADTIYQATFTRTPIVYTITYEGLDEATHSNPISYTVETEATPLTDPSAKLHHTFSGWYLEDQIIGQIGGGLTGNLVVTAIFTPNSYVIRFINEDGSLIEEQTVEYNQLPAVSNIPTKDSENGYEYTFDGWDKELVKAVADTTYQATFKRTPIVYTITYEGLGEATHSNPTSYTVETEATLLTDPSAKLHHTFSGWYLGERKIEQIGGGLTGDLVITAIFTPNSYVIRFINEDGSLIEEQTIEFNQLPTPPTAPTKDAENGYEYTFDGWDKEVVKAVADTTYQATFKATPIVYTITYEGIEGATHSNVETYTIEQEILLSDATKVGYQFLGWFTEALEGEKVESISLGSTGNLTLYARFSEIEPETYIIEFVNEGVIISTQNVLEGNMPTIPTDPEKPMTETQTFTFSGWSPAVDVATQDITYIATYTASPRAYTITYLNLPDGADNSSNPITYTPRTGTFSLSDPILPAGYTFIGWYENNEPITTILRGTTGNKVLTAKIEVKTYQINYDVGIGTNPNNNPSYPHNHEGIVLYDAIAPNGYDFIGWHDGTQIISEITLGRTGDLNLVAHYQIITYTITYVLDGATNPNTKETYTIESDTFIIENPSKVGFNFVGWIINDTLNAVVVIQKGSTGDITLTASFEEKSFSITYHLNGGINSENNVSSYTYLTENIILENAFKEGYTFIGWYHDNEQIEVITKHSMINYELIAKYSPIVYSITYIVDGNNASNPTTYTTDKGAQLAHPTKAGYVFVNWSDQHDNIVSNILPGTIGDLILTAHFVEATEGAFINIINPLEATITVINDIDIYHEIPVGTEVVIQVVPIEKHRIEKITYAGEILTPIDNAYTFTVYETAILYIEQLENIEYEQSLYLLAIGNSFTQDAFQYFAELLKDAGVKHFVVAYLYRGGTSLSYHLDQFNNNGASYSYRKYTYNGTNINYQIIENQTIQYGLDDETWDIITVQQVSQDSGDPNTIEPTLTNLITKLKNYTNTPNTKYGYHMTWAYHEDSNHSQYGKYNHDQMTMYNAIIQTTQTKVLTNHHVNFVIPSGTAIQNARNTRIGDNLTIPDGYHLNPLGRYIAALMWVKQITNVNIKKITYVPVGLGIQSYFTEIKHAVNQAYANPYQVMDPLETEDPVIDPINYDNYHKINYTYDLGFWNVGQTTLSQPPADQNPSALHYKYVGSSPISKIDLPVGSVIKVEPGFRVRIVYFTKTGSSYTCDYRLEPIEGEIILDGDMWGNYDYIGFNISRTGTPNISHEIDVVASHVGLYVLNP